MASSEVAVIIPAYLPSEKNTIEKTISYLRDNVNSITKSNLYLCYNIPLDDNISNYTPLLNILKTLSNVIQVIGSKSKAENLNKCIDSLPDNFNYIIIYDADARPGKNSVDDLYKAIKDLPTYGYVQGRYTFSRGNNIFTRLYDEMENILNNVVLPTFSRCHYFGGHDAILRREAVEDVDGFDPNKLLEDADISCRLMSAGWKTGYLYNHQSASESTASLKDFVKQRHRWYAGRFDINPWVVIFRFILAIIWIALYWIYPLYTFIITLILGLILLRFNLGLVIIFLIYPFVILFLTIYFFIHGTPKSFKPTNRDSTIAGGKRLKYHWSGRTMGSNKQLTSSRFRPGSRRSLGTSSLYSVRISNSPIGV